MLKLTRTLITCAIVATVPIQAMAEYDDSISCSEDEICTTDIAPYEPTECELSMWDIYAAADQAVQDLFKRPICEDLVANWYDGDISPSMEAHESLNSFVELNSKKANIKKVVVSKRKLKKLKQAARSCK